MREQVVAQKVGNRSGIGKSKSGVGQRPAKRGSNENIAARLRSLLTYVPLALRIGDAFDVMFSVIVSSPDPLLIVSTLVRVTSLLSPRRVSLSLPPIKLTLSLSDWLRTMVSALAVAVI